MVLISVAISLLVFYVTVYYYFTKKLNYWKKRDVLSPPANPFVGNFKELILRTKHVSMMFEDIYSMFPNEKFVGIYAIIEPALLVRDLEIIKQIMIKDSDIFMDRGAKLFDKFKLNLFHSDGYTWKALRRRLSPLFTTSKLKNMFYLIEESVDKFLNYVDTESRRHSEHDVHSLLLKFAKATISACAFGVNDDTFEVKQDALTCLDELCLRSNMVVQLKLLFPNISKLLNLSELPAPVTNFFYDIVRTVTLQRGGKPTGRNDFMDLMLALRQEKEIRIDNRQNKNMTLEITDDLIASQAFAFYMAGNETIASSLAYLLYRVALEPRIQNRLVQEINESLRVNNGKITYESIMDMKYLDKVYKETLRMYPVADPVLRRATADYKIPGTDVVIRKGQTIFVSAKAIHYDENYYPNPHKFDPERFSADVAENRHPCAFIPFGIGQRNCIGKRFAQVQARLFVAKLLSKFRVEPSENTKKSLEVDTYRLIVCPKDGIHLRFVLRDNKK